MTSKLNRNKSITCGAVVLAVCVPLVGCGGLASAGVGAASYAASGAGGGGGGRTRERQENPQIPAAGTLHDDTTAQGLVDKMIGAGMITHAKVVITGDSWEIERNDTTGIVTGRYTSAATVYKLKEDGVCVFETSALFRQEHDGSDFMKPGEWMNTVGGEEYEVPCEKVGLPK